MYFVPDTTRRGSLAVPLETNHQRSCEQRIFSAEIKIFFHKEAAELFIILLYCLLPSPTPLHPFPQRRRKLEVGLRDSFHDTQMSTSQISTFHDNMYIVTTAFKWFRNCSVIYCSSSKVDLRHLGMSLIILRTVIVARNE